MKADIEIKLLEQMAKKKVRTIEELHNLSGVSRSSISGLLNGNRKSLSFDNLAKICIALDCTIDDLVVIKDGQAN